MNVDCGWKGKLSEIEACAQVRSAEAAEEASFWAAGSFIVAFAGIFALIWQLVVTRKAIQAGATANLSAQEANTIALEALHNDRAWMCPVGARHNRVEACHLPNGDVVHNSLAFNAEWKNAGRTPATRVVLSSDIRAFPWATKIIDATWNVPDVSSDELSSLVGPEQVVSSQMLSLGEYEIAAFRRREMFFVLASKAFYYDIFDGGKLRNSSVRFIIKHQGGPVILPDGQTHEMITVSVAPYDDLA